MNWKIELHPEFDSLDEFVQDECLIRIYQVLQSEVCMGISLNDKISGLSKKRQDKVEKRAQELIQEELTLRDLRLALEKTQVELCKVLNMKQDGISRLEHRSDMLISTLTKYINAMGGNLKITAEFPDRSPVKISGIESLANQKVN